jgi:DNA-binding FadR family transcriptional regulator
MAQGKERGGKAAAKPPKPRRAGPAKVHMPEKIAAEIGAAILSGKLKSKARLATENSASSERLISRPAYREAVRILVAKGLIEAWPGVGTRVASPDGWHMLDPEVLSWMFAREPRLASLAALFELRTILEPQIAALAAQRRTPKQLSTMGAALDTMARASMDSEEGRRADEVFHLTLIDASGNPFFRSMSGSVTAAIAGTMVHKYRAETLHRDCLPDHMKVFEAVATGDSKASAEAMHALIGHAFSDAVDAMPGVAP